MKKKATNVKVFLKNHYGLVSLFFLAYIPNLIDQPNTVAADNKLYLYLDPIKFLSEVPFIFSPQTWLGTVTFQHIGYLLPYGPYYALTFLMRIPTWVAQRILTGSLLYFAGAGIYYLTYELNFSKTARFVSSLAYMLSPYSLQYLNRISDILLPFSALGWLLTFCIKATKTTSLRYPALFAITVAVIGGTNGSSLIYALIAPVFWLIYTAFVSKEIPFKRFFSLLATLAGLSLLVSIWWMLAYIIDLKYALNILKYTETVQATTSTSSSAEVLRGLGYWFYYGTSAAGSWAISSIGYQEHIWLILISFTIPALALLSACLIRWQHRNFFVIILVIGMILSVSAYPFSSPSLLGNLLKLFMLKTTFGNALRSSDRATPLVVLSLSIFLGAGSAGLQKFLKEKINKPQLLTFCVFFSLCSLIVLNYPSLYNQELLTPQYLRPSNLPSYYYQAAKFLNNHSKQTRILVEPGDVSSVYSWGVTTDPILPAIVNRPIIQRDQVVGGTPASLDLITSLDDEFQNDTINPEAIAPIARLESAGDLLIQSDLAYWIYDLPDPREIYSELTPVPSGLKSPYKFGKAVANLPPKNEHLFIGEQVLPSGSRLPWPSPIMVYPVSNPRPIIRAESTKNPVIIDGSASGLIEAASVNLLENNPTIFYYSSVSFKSDKKLIQSLMNSGASLILTDSNAKQAHRWGGSVLDTTGEIQTTSQSFNPTDYGNQPLILFPSNNASTETVTVYEGIKDVTASAYGNQVNYVVGQRPYLALDGNPSTAWEFSAQAYSLPQWWQVTFLAPLTVNKISLSQALPDTSLLYITKVTLTFDNNKSFEFKLNKTSLTPKGQTLSFPSQTFSQLRITIDSINYKKHQNTGTYNVGFSRVNIGGIQAGYVIRTPIDMLTQLGAATLNHRLTILLSRLREGGVLGEPQPETYLSREFFLPTQRTFSISGTLNISNSASDEVIDSILGRSNLTVPSFVARSSGHSPGYLTTIASAAFDDNPNDAWEPGSGSSNQLGSWVELDSPKILSFNHISLRVLNDMKHSIPTQLELSTEQGIRLLKLPKIPTSKVLGSTYKVSFSFPEIAGRVVRITVLKIKPKYERPAVNQPYFELPIAIGDIKIPGVRLPAYPKEIPQKCYNNLLFANGVPLPNNQSTGIPIPIKLIGPTQDALAGKPIKFVGCGSSSQGITLPEGYNTIISNPGAVTGLSIDTLNLDSAPGGAPEALEASGDLQPENFSSTSEHVNVLKNTSTLIKLSLKGQTRPFWLVLGESYDKGFKISVSGAQAFPDTLIDGFANGWLLKPKSSKPIFVTIYFYPQRYLNWSLILGAIVLIALIIIAIKSKSTQRGFTQTHNFTFNIGELFKLYKNNYRSIKIFKEAFLISLTSCILAMLLCNWQLAIIMFFGYFIATINPLKIFISKFTPALLAFLTGLLIAIMQFVYRYPPNGSWPSSFGFANYLGWACVISLLIFCYFEKLISSEQ